MYPSFPLILLLSELLAVAIPPSPDFWIFNKLVPAYIFSLISSYSLTSQVGHLQAVFWPYALKKNYIRIRLLDSLFKKIRPDNTGPCSHKGEAEQWLHILYGA